MTKFEKRFFTVLKEQDDDEKEAFENSLDQDTNPEEFDVDLDVEVSEDDPSVRAASAVAERNEAMKDELRGGIGKMEEFLANAEPDTVFDRMKQSEQRKISRVATELAGVTESFKGYLAQTGNPQFKYV